jgi:hypothetical protein
MNGRSSIRGQFKRATQPDDSWAEFKKMFRLKKFPQVWVSASEPYKLSMTKENPYLDTVPFFEAPTRSSAENNSPGELGIRAPDGSFQWTESWS